MKKEVNLFRIAGIALCVLMILLSLLPCIRKDTIRSSGSVEEVVNSSRTGFFPQFFGVITALEIGFLFIKKRGFRIVGLVLDIVKFGLPLLLLLTPPVMIYICELGEDYAFSGYEYTAFIPLLLSYVLFFLGLVNAVLYIFHFRAEKLALSTPAASVPPQVEPPEIRFKIPGR